MCNIRTLQENVNEATAYALAEGSAIAMKSHQLDREIAVYDHVLRFGADKSLINLCRRDNKLCGDIGIQFPTMESFESSESAAARYSAAIIVAMEDGDGIWGKFVRLVKAVIKWIREKLAAVFSFVAKLLSPINRQLGDAMQYLSERTSGEVSIKNMTLYEKCKAALGWAKKNSTALINTVVQGTTLFKQWQLLRKSRSDDANYKQQIADLDARIRDYKQQLEDLEANMQIVDIQKQGSKGYQKQMYDMQTRDLKVSVAQTRHLIDQANRDKKELEANIKKAHETCDKTTAILHAVSSGGQIYGSYVASSDNKVVTLGNMILSLVQRAMGLISKYDRLSVSSLTTQLGLFAVDGKSLLRTATSISSGSW